MKIPTKITDVWKKLILQKRPGIFHPQNSFADLPDVSKALSGKVSFTIKCKLLLAY
jgi:hypothetical protein